MTSIELQLCDIQGRLFKLSVRRGINSTEFIKVFMKLLAAKALDSILRLTNYQVVVFYGKNKKFMID